MTGKRFKSIRVDDELSYIVIDGMQCYIDTGDDVIVEGKLNQLLEENEQLKQSNKDARHILKREFDFATEQRQKHLDDPVVVNAYDIIRFDMRKALDKLGWLE